MKKLIAAFTMVVALGLDLSQTAQATDGLIRKKAELAAEKLSSYYPEGVLIGPGSAYYSSTGSLYFAWYGDPLPAGAYYYINDYNIEYQSAGFPGSEGNAINIPMSAFGGPGTYFVGIVYWDGGVIYNYVLPVTVNLL
ncbi:hypothetical protein [Pedobacter sp. ASV12]|uniref:hypothetical protein n=1 Tax=Pedobacter sp. ASV12 TaxID=2795120 RepID=UPI0018EBBBE9|nr:hypothetical protein [Pedobacter sp. ASV12]